MAKKMLDIAISFVAGAVCVWTFGFIIGPFTISVAPGTEPVIVKVNKLSGRAQIYLPKTGWHDLK